MNESRQPLTTAEAAFSVTGMNCAGCVNHVEKTASAVTGVASAQVNLARGRATVTFDARVTSALIGASRPAQITELVGALQNLHFSADELAAIDQHAVDGGINLWQRSSAEHRPA